MKKSIEDLLALQDVDIRIRNLKIRFNTIPTERAKLVAEFNVFRKKLEDEKQKLLKLNQEVKSCEAEIQGLQERHRGLLTKSAAIKKAAEFQASLIEIDTAKKLISDLETKEIELLDQIESQTKAVASAEKQYRSNGKLIQGEVLELDALKEHILAEAKEKAQISALNEKRIPQTLLAQYKRILAGGKGKPLGKIEGGLCPNCNMHLPPMTINEAKKGDVVFCDSCSYMLYDPDAKTE